MGPKKAQASVSVGAIPKKPLEAAIDDADIFEFMQSLPPQSLDKLYGGAEASSAALTAAPWTCRAVLQSLPPLAKQYVMRLVCVEVSISRELIKSWVADAFIRVHEDALDKLESLRVLVPDEEEAKLVRLNPPFRTNLQRGLVEPDVTPWRDDPRYTMKSDKQPPSIARIEADMHKKWEGVLYFLTGSDMSQEGIPDPVESVVLFMERAGLMRRTHHQDGLIITDKGYEFMLRDVHIQAWTFVLALVKDQGSESAARDDLLSFLFMLSYCTVGEDYPLAALSEIQTRLAKDFIDLGLLYQRKPKSNRFYVTSIAVNLIFGASSKPSRALIQMSRREEAENQAAMASGGLVPQKPVSRSSMGIIVETNYQVVAYTSSNLHLAMLSLFIEHRARLPNMVVGVISRESVHSALEKGIKAQQILDFLKWHAHSSVLNRVPSVPENVADHIVLWEQERSKVKYEEGVLIDLSMLSVESFVKVVSYAHKGCLWSSATKKLLVVTEQVHQKVIQFAKTVS